jgi:NAD(P)-dependent dehydrogenase (short-subunit alcohol dehydrogenase family)
VLHNNDMIDEVGGPVETTEESWDRVNDVNPEEHFPDLQAGASARGAGGRSSTSHPSRASAGVPHLSYAAPKAAVIQFTCVTALQYARSGIRANSILPGVMKYADGHAPGVIAA